MQNLNLNLGQPIYIPQGVASAEAAITAEVEADKADALYQPGQFPIDALSPVAKAIVESVAVVHRLPLELPAMTAKLGAFA